MRPYFLLSSLLAVLAAPAATSESYEEIVGRLGRDTEAAYAASPFAILSEDYFARFHRSVDRPERDELVHLDEGWRILIPEDPAPVTERMAGYLAAFLAEVMQVNLPVEQGAAEPGQANVLSLLETGGGLPDVAESFTIQVEPGRVTVQGRDANGLRDGIVRLVDRMGFAEAPSLEVDAKGHSPRLPVRLGTIPKNGSHRELVFLGYNAIFTGGGSLYALSTSDAIPELAVRRVPGLLEGNRESAAEARAHGLKTYAFVGTREKFPEDDPIFKAHPEIRGARTWRADGEFVLCTEHPLVKQWLTESVAGVFEADPQLTGMVLIIGGESFYHCYMRPHGVEKGRTNCERCDPLGAEQVVANLCNNLAAAAREISPEAEMVVWPYSAEHVWSVDHTQEVFISKLKPGVALLTEIEKSEYVEKPGGVRKHLWDYSIDLIGPGPRAQAQIAAAQEAGINVYLKSEPELGFEAARLPQIPCMDRWVGRAEALASSGATGAWVFPAFRPNYGTSAAEVKKFVWWEPVPEHETLLEQFAARLVGTEAGPHLRRAWAHVSAAIPLAPVIPPYYKGPQYTGPAHPMVADLEAELPEVFYGYYLFLAEITTDEGVKRRPTYERNPVGDAPVFADYYRRMEVELRQAVEALEEAKPLVPEEHALMFAAEESPTRWFYHTTRSTANFYEACQLRDKILAASAASDDKEALEAAFTRWREILEDERENTLAALPVVQADMRLDFHYGSDHTFPHAAVMMEAKLKILNEELNTFLPSAAEERGLEAGTS